MTIVARIQAHYAELPPQARRAADAILDHADDLALYSSAELAEISGVSQATLSRLYRQLGFSSFAEVRDEARLLRGRGVPLDRSDHPVALTDHLEADLANVRRCLEGLDPDDLATVGRHLAHDRRVAIIGTRNSYPFALHLRQQLIQVRGGVELLPLAGQTLGEDVVDVAERDTVVLFGFRRRRRDFPRILRACRDSGAFVVLIADTAARRYSAQAAVWFSCPLDAPGAFDSYAAPMALAALLASTVATELGDEGRRRVTRVTGTYEALDELDA